LPGRRGGLSSVDGAEPGKPKVKQEELDGTDYAKIKFVGMSFDELNDVPGLGERMRFEVEGTVVGRGGELLETGGERRVAKVKVDRVKLLPVKA
jgi:hypothetical protein